MYICPMSSVYCSSESVEKENAHFKILYREHSPFDSTTRHVMLWYWSYCTCIFCIYMSVHTLNNRLCSENTILYITSWREPMVHVES